MTTINGVDLIGILNKPMKHLIGEITRLVGTYLKIFNVQFLSFDETK